MKMLTVFLIIVGFLSYNSYTFAELTVDDLEKIREIVDKSDARVEKISKNILQKQKNISQGTCKLWRNTLGNA